MSVLDRLKSLISGTKKDIDESLTKETKTSEPEVDSKQTSSEEEINESNSETNSKEEPSKVEVPITEEVITPVHAEEEPEVGDEPEEAVEEVSVEEVSEDESEEAVEEVSVEEVSLENDENLDEDNASEEETETEENSDAEVPEETNVEENLEAEETDAEEDLEAEETDAEEDLDAEESDAEESEVEEESEEDDSEENEESDNMTLLNENDVYSMDDIDKEFTQKFIDAGLETVDHCFQCGTCGGGCPSGRRTPYRVRQIVRKCLLGLKEEVISDPALWMCTTCYTCQERCPRSVEIVGIIKMARNVAAQAGYMADAHKATGSFVIKSGHGVPINDKTKALRKEIGLSEVPPTTHAYPEALDEVRAICAACKFDELIGFNMETNELE